MLIYRKKKDYIRIWEYYNRNNQLLFNYLPEIIIHAINKRICEIICCLGFNIFNDPLSAAMINVTIRKKKKKRERKKFILNMYIDQIIFNCDNTSFEFIFTIFK
jgi:hypothetical protein